MTCTDSPACRDEGCADCERSYGPGSSCCPFCLSCSHSDVRDCPDIDPESLILEVHPGEPCTFDSSDHCTQCGVHREDL